MRLNSESWKRFVFYGEVVGFVLAWVVGVAVLTRSRTADDRIASVDGLANAEVGRNRATPREELLK